MGWDTLFSVVSFIAVMGWALLLFAPRRPLTHAVVFFLGIGLLCLIYTIGLGSALLGGGDDAGFGSIEEVRAIFSSDAGVVVGWTHYLAFDLFAGQWIARDADLKKVSRLVQAPILLATLLAGPAGLLIWIVVREVKRRRQSA